MNKLFLIKNPELFQGETYLNKNKNYFEGWYFKNTNNEHSISFIPGINIDKGNKKAFVQIITDDVSYFVDYCIEDFKYNYYPFSIQIGNNTFSKGQIHIDIKNEEQNLNCYGDIKYSNNKNIKSSCISPNIMGPFSYIPFMECNHAIISMQNSIEGTIQINDNKINFNNGIGYIEKDWGISFPKKYIWCQGNRFKNTNASFMISIADIPFKCLRFKGLICVLIIDNMEYKFTTYNKAKIVKYIEEENSLNITLKKGKYELNMQTKPNSGHKLMAPMKGSMNRDIIESITSSITVTLKENESIIFADMSTDCGLEVV